MTARPIKPTRLGSADRLMPVRILARDASGHCIGGAGYFAVTFLVGFERQTADRAGLN
jgi:hypothetical protein